MGIISLSLDNETLDEIEKIQKKLGFKSRSKMVRSTIDSMLTEYRRFDQLRGRNDVVFIITYKEHERNNVSSILHKFEDAIKITVHQHHSALCLDILNVNAEADRVRELFGVLKRSKCVKSLGFDLLGAA